MYGIGIAGEGYQCRRGCSNARELHAPPRRLVFKGRDWFQERLGSIPQDDALIAELTAPTYTFTSTGKMVVESKADMKKRGMRSTDLADAFLAQAMLGDGPYAISPSWFPAERATVKSNEAALRGTSPTQVR